MIVTALQILFVIKIQKPGKGASPHKNTRNRQTLNDSNLKVRSCFKHRRLLHPQLDSTISFIIRKGREDLGFQCAKSHPFSHRVEYPYPVFLAYLSFCFVPRHLIMFAHSRDFCLNRVSNFLSEVWSIRIARSRAIRRRAVGFQEPEMVFYIYGTARTILHLVKYFFKKVTLYLNRLTFAPSSDFNFESFHLVANCNCYFSFFYKRFPILPEFYGINPISRF